LEQVVDLQKKSAIALSSFLLAVHAKEWNDLPKPVIDRGVAVLTKEQRTLFFS
jgi:hypothetical protein